MSYIICFWDKSRLQISDEAGEKLKAAIQAEQIKNFILGESLYAVSGVEKIVPKYQAYDIYPADYEQLNAMEDIPPAENFVKLNSGQALLNN